MLGRTKKGTELDEVCKMAGKAVNESERRLESWYLIVRSRLGSVSWVDARDVECLRRSEASKRRNIFGTKEESLQRLAGYSRAGSRLQWFLQKAEVSSRNKFEESYVKWEGKFWDAQNTKKEEGGKDIWNLGGDSCGRAENTIWAVSENIHNER